MELAELALTTAAGGGIEVRFVPDAGMLCASLRHRGEELLGQRAGLDAYVSARATMAIPLLHPWANRVQGMRFETAGQEVVLDDLEPPVRVDGNGLPTHGLLAGVAGWEVEHHDAGRLAARFDLAAHPELVRAFPFPHELRYEATLRDTTLTIATTVFATGGAPVPIAFGFHPYLRLPGVPREEWEIEVPVAERLELDARMLPTGATTPVRVEPGALGTRTFDDAYVAPPAGTPFVLAGGGRRLEVAFDAAYPYAQVFAPASDDVVAFEPMTAPANALASGDGLRVLQPGERFEAVFSLTVG